MGVKFADKAATTITGDIAADATSVTVSSASGFPDVTGAGDFFYATLERANDTTTYEVVKVTNLSSTTYTIDRSIDSSSTFSTGDTFALRLNEHAIVDPSLLQAGITTNSIGMSSVTVTDIKDEDDMASNSATMLATQQSIKAYVDAQVDTADSLSEILAISNTTGGTKIEVDNTSGGIDLIDNAKIRLGTGDDLEVYHDGSNSHILDKGTGSLSLDSAHFAVRSGATDAADSTPTEHIRMQVLAGASGTTAFSAGTESSGSLSTGMTNPRLQVSPISGDNAGFVRVNGKLSIYDDPIDSSKTGSGDLSVTGDISGTNLDLGGNIEIDGEITKPGGGVLTVNNGTTFTQSSGDNTALQVLNTGTPSETFTCYASIEVGGNGGSFIDVKKPSGNDYDLRIEHGITAEDQSLITSKHPLIVQTQSGGGEVTIKREGSTKLATSSAGIDVTGTVTADALTMGDNQKITLGAGGDLEIFSDGATSFIEQPSGATGSDNLVIKGENVLIKNDAGQELIGTFSDVARLSNQGNVKLVTETVGVKITGVLKLVDSSDNVTTIQEGASGDITLTLPSSAGTLALTSEIPTVPSSGISNGNVATFTSGVVDNDFLRVDGTSIEGLSDTELKSALSLAKADVGLGNVDNESKSTMFTTPTFTNEATFSGSITGNPTTDVNDGSGGADVTLVLNKKFINTKNDAGRTLTLPGSATAGNIIMIVNSSNQTLTINRNTNSITTSIIDTGQGVQSVTGNTFSIIKGGVAEVVYTGAAAVTVFGSGVLNA